MAVLAGFNAWGRYSAMPPGRLSHISGVFYDITARRQADEALRESEEKYRSLVETTNTGYVIIDPSGQLLDANPEFVRMTGNSELGEILGITLLSGPRPRIWKKSPRP